MTATAHRDSRPVAAVDLGATSGRVILGQVRDGVLHSEVVARFPNNPVHTLDGMHWNILELYRNVLVGLAEADRRTDGELATIGVDSWAVDYGLLRNGRLLGAPYHYRDHRSDAGVEKVHDLLTPTELYRHNGLQHLPFNTLFQLAVDADLTGLAERLLLIPDLFSYWLTGTQNAERTNASTTGLLGARSRNWDDQLVETLGIPRALLPTLVDPGDHLGNLTGAAAQTVGREIDVVAVGSHDTASAVAAIPSTDPRAAYVSCGTWGLAGLDIDHPVLSEDARLGGFTNEAGVDGSTRFLHNVMGLWLLSESMRTWEPTASDELRHAAQQELLQEASALAPRSVPVFDVDDPRFLSPGDIPGRIAEWCREHGEKVPESRAAMVRSILESLAEAFATTISRAAELADTDVPEIHITGGGSKNALLCQATADRSGIPVIAGPSEATGMGNLLVQVRASGGLAPGLDQLRSTVARSTPLTRFAPRGRTHSAEPTALSRQR